MIRQYLNASLRFLSKNWTHTAINLFGLTLGITCSLMIFRIVTFEFGFDKYHAKADRIYRVVNEYTHVTEDPFNSGSTYPMAPALRKDFPDPEHVVLVDGNLGDIVMTIPGDESTPKRFKENRLCFADPGYFQIFDHEFISGTNQALNTENSVVISESVAKKYFGAQPALNKVINFNNEYDVTVTAVIKDPPLNTTLWFPIVLSSKVSKSDRGWTNWGSTSSALNTFVLLREGISKEDFDKKLEGWHLQYYSKEDQEDAKNIRYFLQPLGEIHYDARFDLFGGQNVVSYATLYTLIAVGILLLLTACVNFVNLNTVLITARSKEVGIRKTLGSNRTSIAFQFLAETFIIACISLAVSIGVAEVILSLLSPILGYNIGLKPFGDRDMTMLILALPVVVTILAGLYPALRLSRFQPLEAIRNKLANADDSGLPLRRILVVFQLVIAQGLVVATIIIIQQMQHVSTQPLGLAKESVVEFDIPERKPELIRAILSRLKQIPGVEHATVTNSGSISENTWNSTIEATVKGSPVKESVQIKFTDDSFLDTYQIRLLAGRNLPSSDTTNGFVVNEEFAKMLGFESVEEALGVKIRTWGLEYPIIGVVSNFNTTSLHSRIRPLLMMSNTRYYYNGAVRLQTSEAPQTIAAVQKAWEEVFSKYVFEYTYLDETVENFYATERRNTLLVGIFAFVAILIGCLGLYGLISFMAQRKVKEIGVRKVLGATVSQIVTLLSREFLFLIAVAFILSAPVVYYFAQEWLSNFAYRIDVGVLTFALGLTFTVVIVLLTVGIRSYNAATANPVDALRSE